ncbi:transposase, partial [Ferroplasma sp.]|uniref:transposase n=1 Tax=Ferroplasma sp. TaxID=2591003 RepID=UPI0026125F01
AGWSSFFAMLKTKALQRGKNVIEIGMFEPSSKMCSGCGSIKKDLKLSDRTYHCNACGLTIDRDLNAAINVWKMGMIKSGVPTDSGEFTPVDRNTSVLSLFEREGIVQVHWLKQEAHVL